MAEVSLSIGGRTYTIACRDGGEEHLRGLAARVNAKVEEARGAVGSANEVRQLLFASLLLADEAAEAGTAAQGSATTSAPTPGPARDPALAPALSALAARVEAIADALESGPHNA